MNEIIRHIEYLLVTHDCVVIPGLGAVLAHCLPARYDKSAEMMLPPSRTFSFNITLNHNDGLLVTSVARAKELTFEAARSLVAGEIEAMRRELDRSGSLSLGLAGRLVSAGGALSFEPASATALSPDYMWLPSIEMVEITTLAKQRAAASESYHGVRQHRGVVDYLSSAVRIAASLVLLIALGFVLSTPIEVENAQYASLGIENFQPVSDSAHAEASMLGMPGHTPSAVTLYLCMHDDACEIVDTAAHAEYIRMRKSGKDAGLIAAVSESSSAVRFNPEDNYYLVVASLVNEADADEFIANSKNKQLGILAKDGRYRVYAATGATYREALSAADLLADSYSSAWVCRK